MTDTAASPAARKRAAAAAATTVDPPADPPAPVERSASRYVVGEVVPTTDGIWIRLIDTVAAGGRHAAVKAVVGTREGRWFVCAESNSEILTYGPPPDPTPTLVASQSVGAVLAEPPIAMPLLPVEPEAVSPSADFPPFPGSDQPGYVEAVAAAGGVQGSGVAGEGDPIPLTDVDDPRPVDAAHAREGQPIPIDPDVE